MRLLIVEDEPLATERLKRILQSIGRFSIVDFKSAEDALAFLRRDSNFDVAFLDIRMPGISGIELAYRISAINPDIFIVFQTAYSNYALDAFRVGAIDYIVKPYLREDILKVIDRITKYSKKVNKRKILVKTSSNSYELVDCDEILFIKAELHESVLVTNRGEFLFPANISILEKKLKDLGFERVHRSYLINLKKVSKIKTVEQSKLKFYFKDSDLTVTSSKEGGKTFREKHKGEYQLP